MSEMCICTLLSHSTWFSLSLALVHFFFLLLREVWKCDPGCKCRVATPAMWAHNTLIHTHPYLIWLFLTRIPSFSFVTSDAWIMPYVDCALSYIQLARSMIVSICLYVWCFLFIYFFSLIPWSSIEINLYLHQLLILINVIIIRNDLVGNNNLIWLSWLASTRMVVVNVSFLLICLCGIPTFVEK